MKSENQYTKQIGILNTKQFKKLQEMLIPLNEMERMEILYNQLKVEIEHDIEMDAGSSFTGSRSE